MAKKTIQKRVAEELSQREETITIGGREYKVAPPCLMTLVYASEEFAEIPEFEISRDNLAVDVIREARKAKNVARPLAVMILGAEAIEKAKTHNHTNLFIKLFRRKKNDIVGRLAKEIALHARSGEITEAVAQLIGRQDIGDFFALTAFLSAVNITKPTKAETKTTASGR